MAKKVYIQVQCDPDEREMLQAIADHKRVKYGPFIRSLIHLYHERLPDRAKIPQQREATLQETG